MSEDQGRGGIFMYVAHHRAKEFEAVGWEYSEDLGPPHSAYSSLYKWVGEGEPVIPEPRRKISDEI